MGIGPHDAGIVKVAHMLPFLGLGVLLAGLVVWTHRGNIARLRAGTEPRAGQRVHAAPPS
jgi:glycerol-3-phosphate acyltransferase PlsY